FVRHHEANGRPLAAHHAARLDQTSEPKALPRSDLHRGHLARRIEEDNRIPHGVEHEANGDPEHQETGADGSACSLLRRHDVSPSPAASASGCSIACMLALNWLLARASAFCASSLRSSTL